MAHDTKWAKEVVTDALDHPSRLTDWERKFCADLNTRLAGGRMSVISEAQQEVLERIEDKVYAS